MPTWLRSLVDAFLGKVPDKTSRLDTATRMARDADMSDRRESIPHDLVGGEPSANGTHLIVATTQRG